MKDPQFIQSILQKGKEAREKVSSTFSAISGIRLNWKPNPDSWSIGQCLEHLVNTHNSYLPDLKKITDGKYAMNFWEKFSPLTGMWGRVMKDQLQEQVGRKMKAPKKIQPSKSALQVGFVDRYLENLDEFLRYISKCSEIDIDKTIITSPLLSMVTYNLRDAFQFLLQHEHRHINQAMRVKNNDQFP